MKKITTVDGPTHDPHGGTGDPEDAPGLWIPYGATLDLSPEVGDGVVVGLVHVTPELAELWLERNTRNRKISPQSVDRYARNMTHDHWAFTGDSVKFSNAGELLDGQHRLTAVARVGVTVPLLVVSGLPTESQAFMDDGRKRNAGDVLAIRRVTNYVAVAALARLALLWNPGGLWVPERGTQLLGTHVQVSTTEIMEFVEAHPAVHEAARRGVAAGNAVPGFRASVIGAAYLRATELPGGVFDAESWFTALETGAGLTLGDPALALRNGVMRARAEKFSNPQVPQLWKVIRAWNASRDGQEMDRVVMTPQGVTNANFPDMH